MGGPGSGRKPIKLENPRGRKRAIYRKPSARDRPKENGLSWVGNMRKSLQNRKQARGGRGYKG